MVVLAPPSVHAQRTHAPLAPTRTSRPCAVGGWELLCGGGGVGEVGWDGWEWGGVGMGWNGVR